MSTLLLRNPVAKSFGSQVILSLTAVTGVAAVGLGCFLTSLTNEEYATRYQSNPVVKSNRAAFNPGSKMGEYTWW